MRRMLLLHMLLLAFGILSLHAQSPEDILLSHDPGDSTLATDLRIQAALEHGGRRLVVWGTQVTDGDSVIGALVMNLDGVQSVMTSNEARPYGAVDIVPMGSEDFLVMWNDRREEGAGIRGAVVDGRSGDVAADRTLDSGFAFTGMVAFRRGANRLQIFYATSSSGTISTRLLEIDDVGASVGVSSRIADGSFSAGETYLLPNGMLSIKLGDGSILLWDDQGAVDGTLAATRFALPHYLTEEGGIVLYENDSAKSFRSIFDPSPDSVVAVPIELPVPPTSSRVVHALHRDSIGWYLVAHAWFHPHDASGLTSFVVDREIVRFDFKRPSDTTIHRAMAMLLAHPVSATTIGVSLSIALTRHEANITRIQMSGVVTYDPINTTFIRSDTFYGVHTIGSGGGMPSAHSSAVVRTRFHVMSDVRVNWPDEPSSTLSYSIPIVPHIFRTSHGRPALFASRDISVGWHTTDGMLGSAVVDPVDISIEPYIYVTRPAGNVLLPTGGIIGQPARPALSTAAMSHASNPEHSTGLYLATSDIYPKIYRLDSIGRWSWFVFPRIYTWRITSSSRIDPVLVEAVTPTFDPNRREMAVMVRLQARDNQSLSAHNHHFAVYSVDEPNRMRIWSAGLPRLYDAMLSVDSGVVYLAHSNDTLERFPKLTGGSSYIAMRSVDTALKEKTILLQRLLGQRFLRITAVPGYAYVTYEIYDFGGRLIGQRSVGVIPSGRGMDVVQNPSDSSIIILQGTADGTVAMMFSQTLQSLELEDGTRLGAVTISQTSDSTAYPSGVVRDGRLYVAWEDYRSSATRSEIRGNWWTIPRAVVPAPAPFDPLDPEVIIPFTPQQSLKINAVAPNPLVTSATLRIESLRDQEATVVLLNMRGEEIRRIPIVIEKGMREYPLDLTGVEGGAYAVRVDGLSESDGVVVIVMGE